MYADYILHTLQEQEQFNIVMGIVRGSNIEFKCSNLLAYLSHDTDIGNEGMCTQS